MMVYIVVNLDCGWDNIVGVFDEDDVSREHLLKVFPGEQFHIFRQFVWSDTEDFE